jgi:TrmH family RNA methyltransferase
MAVPLPLISSRTNSRVKQLRAAFSGTRRLSEGLIAIEGEHLLQEALRSGIIPKTIFVTPQYSKAVDSHPDTEMLLLSEDVFESTVETHSPQGVAALIEPPAFAIEEMLHSPALILIAAELQDPGNLGTLIRSAEAFGATGVLLTPGTVGQWNQKVIRSSVGSVFRVPVTTADEVQVAALQERGLRLLAAIGSQDGNVLNAQEANLRQPSAIMIGNEGAGLSDNWLRLANARVTIPCPGPVESLNAAIAGSLLLYEASRQRSSPAQSISNNVPRIPNMQPRRPTGATR